MTSPELFKCGMRRLAAGVSLITTVHGGQRHGLVATSVTSLSAEPPSLIACINRKASAHDPLIASGVFCVNILAGDADEVAGRFSSPAHRQSRFETIEWTSLETGAPILAEALANFDCEIEKTIEHASHTILVGSVVAIRLPDRAIAPLIYVDGRYHDLGLPLV